MRPMTLSAAFIAIVAIAAATPSVRAVTAVSNVENPDPTGYTNPPEAVSFTTGDQPAVLNSISAPYFCFSTFGLDMVASLRADAGGQLGGPLEILPEQINRAAPVYGTVTFPSAGALLAPHTTYWFFLDTRTNAEWETTALPSETSAYGWTIGDTAYNGGFYIPGAGRFSVDVTFVPEPATVSLLVPPALALFPRHRHRNSENRR